MMAYTRQSGSRKCGPSWGGALFALVLCCALALTGCQEDKPPEDSPTPGATPSAAKTPGAGGPASLGPPPVVIEDVTKQAISQAWEYPAQTAPMQTVDVRARVAGFLNQVLFAEGSVVHNGQLLCVIDPRTYEADVFSAKANLSKARADLDYAMRQVALQQARADQAANKAQLIKTQQDVNRYKPLAAKEVIPQQTYDNAVAARDVAKAQLDASTAVVRNTQLATAANIEIGQAQVESAKAALYNAELNLSYTNVYSPIDGIIGERKVTEGNLVGQGEATVLATISQTNPMYVDFEISELEYLQVFKEREVRKPKAPPKFQLLLGDNSTFPYDGRFESLGRELNQQTGTIRIRTTFPNPQGLLRPNQFARIKIGSSQPREALLVPQRAVTEMQSVYTVMVVDEENKAAARTIQIGDPYKEFYIVKSGLEPGERVIVDGFQKVKPGQVVKPERKG